MIIDRGQEHFGSPRSFLLGKKEGITMGNFKPGSKDGHAGGKGVSGGGSRNRNTGGCSKGGPGQGEGSGKGGGTGRKG